LRKRKYNKTGLKEIFYILRDFRINKIAEIGTKLIDTLHINKNFR